MMKQQILLLLCASLLLIGCTIQLTGEHPPAAPHPPGHRVAAVNMIDSGLKHLRAGRCRQAIHQFEKAVELDRHSSEAYYWLGAGHYHCADYSRARDSWRVSLRYIKDSPWFQSRVYASIAIAFEVEGRFDDARISYQLALSKDKANGVARTGLGDVEGMGSPHGGAGKGKKGWRGKGRGPSPSDLGHKTEKERFLLEPLREQQANKR